MHVEGFLIQFTVLFTTTYNNPPHFYPLTSTPSPQTRPKFEQLSDNEDGDDGMPDVYSRLTDSKAYKQSGLAVDVWAQRTGMFENLLLYLATLTLSSLEL